MTINSSFLYERRIEAGLSQSDVANVLGYSVQLVSMWESGKNAPSLHVLGKYASLLQIDLEGIIYSKVIVHVHKIHSKFIYIIYFFNYIYILLQY